MVRNSLKQNGNGMAQVVCLRHDVFRPFWGNQPANLMTSRKRREEIQTPALDGLASFGYWDRSAIS
jgi:hypothetical protein